jgi:hypothetical protein
MSVLFALSGALCVTANASTALPANFVQKITLNLSFVGPGKTASNELSATVTSMTITTAEVIDSIGEATTNKFSSAAQLLVITPITYYTNPVVTVSKGKSVTNLYVYGYLGNPSFEIQDGAKVVDVTEFITVNTLNSSTYISSYVETATGNYTSYESYRVRTISVANTGLAFSGQGFVESPLVSVTVKPGVVVFGVDDNWTSFTGVAGNALFNGILQGTISATYERLE